MLPIGLLQVGGGEDEEDIQQEDVLPVGQFSSTGILSFFLQSGELQLACKSSPLDSRYVVEITLVLEYDQIRLDLF